MPSVSILVSWADARGVRAKAKTVKEKRIRIVWGFIGYFTTIN
jgi:hypothetical protein